VGTVSRCGVGGGAEPSVIGWHPPRWGGGSIVVLVEVVFSIGVSCRLCVSGTGPVCIIVNSIHECITSRSRSRSSTRVIIRCGVVV